MVREEEPWNRHAERQRRDDGPDWQEAPAEGKPESASDCSHTALLSAPRLQSKQRHLWLWHFLFLCSFCLSSVRSGKMKASRGEKNNNTVSPVTHKRKHLCVRTLLFKNVYPRSLNDVRTSSSHAVRLLLKSRREQFSLPDSHELMDFHLPGGKTCFGSAFFCLHAHISVRVVIGELHSYKCTHYCVN